MRVRAAVTLAGIAFYAIALAAQRQQSAGSVETLGVEKHAPGKAAPAPATPQQDVTARSWADTTALWVGDRVLFTIEIDCAPTFDILSADLAADKLALMGLEVVESSVERIEKNFDRLKYRFRYRFTTYETGPRALRVGDLSVRYGRRRAGQRMDETVPVGEIRVPGLSLALRSTIPDDVATVDARDRRPLMVVPAALTMARPVGIALIVLSAAPVVIWAAAFARRLRPAKRRPDRRAAKVQSRSALADLSQGDFSSETARREAFTRLEAVVHEHIASVAGLPAAALTSGEISERLTAAKSSLPLETVTDLLQECERVRYGPSRLVPPAERVREAIANAERIVAVTR
jgi:hypothetical protein